MKSPVTLDRLTSRRQQILLMGAVAILPLLPVTFYLPILPKVAESFGSTIHQFQLTLPLYALTQVVAMPVIALLSDAGYRLRTLYWALLLFIVGTLSCIQGVNLWLFYCGRILQGAATAALMMVVPVLVNECYEGNDVAKTLSYVTAIGFIVPTAGPELSASMAGGFGWQSVFWLVLSYAAVVAFFCFRMLGRVQPAPPINYVSFYKNFAHNLLAMLKDKCTLAFMVCNTGVAVVCQIYISNSDFLYLSHFKLDELAYSYLLSAMYLGRMLVSVLNGVWLKHKYYISIIRVFLPVLIALSMIMVFLDWTSIQVENINLALPVILFALSGFVLTNTLAGALKNNERSAMQAISLMFIIYSGVGSVINIVLILFQDGTARALSLSSLLILLATYLLFNAIFPAGAEKRHHL